eukprot:TRINITY_DN1077_c0_g1_i2.p1 TRINITY_DN1077_c0_g1~~TRINITY_DN1077_c0_g1_i2.p1  ORF type:complete len:204 (+),score=34.27 TRINITY_DN1077_c0_g1_i2:88-699(+)
MQKFMGKSPVAWHVVDAKGLVLGRLASKVAQVINGKNKVTFTPHLNNSDHVVIVNARHVVLTGRKWDQKLYRHHTGYPGGLKEEPAKKLIERRPEELLRQAVWGMLPDNTLRRDKITRLHIFADGEHEYAAQKPEPLVFREIVEPRPTSGRKRTLTTAEKIKQPEEVDPATVNWSEWEVVFSDEAELPKGAKVTSETVWTKQK